MLTKGLIWHNTTQFFLILQFKMQIKLTNNKIMKKIILLIKYNNIINYIRLNLLLISKNTE